MGEVSRTAILQDCATKIGPRETWPDVTVEVRVPAEPAETLEARLYDEARRLAETRPGYLGGSCKFNGLWRTAAAPAVARPAAPKPKAEETRPFAPNASNLIMRKAVLTRRSGKGGDTFQESREVTVTIRAYPGEEPKRTARRLEEMARRLEERDRFQFSRFVDLNPAEERAFEEFNRSRGCGCSLGARP